MNKQEQYQALSNFLSWFEDNFADESYLDPDPSDEVIKNLIEQTSKEEVEKELRSCGGIWISYIDSPEFVAADKALEIMYEEGQK